MTGRVSQSSAFPPDAWMPELLASSHATDLSAISSLNDFWFRTSVSMSEMPEVRALHQEWFPVDYNEEFFASITGPGSDVISVIASPRASGSIVGMATVAVKRREARYNVSCDLLPSLNLHSETENVAYILTLGVVDELRQMGLAGALLGKTLEEIARADPACTVVFLHVIEYNEPAMKLYRKHGFLEFKREENFYKIGDTWYAGILFYRELRDHSRGGIAGWVRNTLSHILPNKANSLQLETKTRN